MRVATAVGSAVCTCQQCSAAHYAVDGLSARRPLLNQQSHSLQPYSQQTSHPPQAYVYNESYYNSLNLVHRLRGGSDLLASKCSEVLNTIISNNLAAPISAPYEGSPITITEHNPFVDPGSSFQELQAVKNVRAALTNEYLICRKMGVGWQSCTAPNVDLLREAFIILCFQQPIHQLAGTMARLMRTNVSSCQSLAHCRCIMAATARAWSASLATEFCCKLKPSLAYYSKLVERVAGIHPSSFLDGTIGLSFLTTIIDDFDIKQS